MNLVDACKLMKQFAKCPKCGCETIGGGTGTVECDTAAGYFKRTCQCGWYIQIEEGIEDGKESN